MRDGFGREMTYLRLSLTDQCNLRCRYCMPREGVRFRQREELLSDEELLRLLRLFASLGISKLKLTGGEPLLRPHLKDLLHEMRAISGISEITLTTNGTKPGLLASLLPDLDGVNVSLDTLSPAKFSDLTGGDDFSQVMESLHLLLDEKVNTKINVVPILGINDDEIRDLAALAKEEDLKVRFIELMPIGCGAGFSGVPEKEVIAKIEAAFGPMTPSDFRSNGPASYFALPGFRGQIGMIRGVDHRFCANCNRLRLTADGQLKACLAARAQVNLRDLLRQGASDEELLEAMKNATKQKPWANHFDAAPTEEERRMYEIGG